MRFHFPSLLLPALLSLPGLLSAATQETWETGYKGKDGYGKQVLGYWKFDTGAELKDSSSQGNDLTENGAVMGAEGRFGQGIESAAGMDKPHSVRVTGKGSLTPAGPFSIEMWIKPKAGFENTGRCYLLDKRYLVDNPTDYSWQLMEADKSGSRHFAVTLGLGASIETFFSQPVLIKTDAWNHIAFTYDAAGTVTFYHNGAILNQVTKPGLGAVVGGTRPLFIGDRGGSNFGGFPGFIDEVRICEGVLRFEPVSLDLISSRHVWRRMENAAPVNLQCSNLRREKVAGASLKVEFAGKVETFNLPELNPGSSHTIKFPIDTALKADTYTLKASLQMGESSSTRSLDLTIAPRPAPQMPVIMWGGGPDAMEQLKEVGFTHFFGLSPTEFEPLWDSRLDNNKTPPPAGPAAIERHTQNLDKALASGMNIIASVTPTAWLMNKGDFLRVNREGKPFARGDICASLPELSAFFEKVGRSISRAYGQHPAFAAALVNTEVRDGSQPSFNPVDVENYRKFASTDIPAEVMNRWGVEWRKLKGFPEQRVIADDHPILKYYRWFWTEGDGWNGLHSAMHKGLKSSAHRDFWTFFDPAVRQPSISGAGGNVDVLGHWTYTYPDPQRIGLATDELFAMSEATGRRQHVMKMTQIIWYRSQTSPAKPGQSHEVVAWDDHDPDAAYITIAPMHLREAFWTKLSRPIEGIMYHGWQSLVQTDSTGAYRFTNPNTVHVLKELLHDVLRPLGPTLMAIPGERSEVAMLESFTSQIFARRGGWGMNNNWSADVWMALQHAHVQPDILYEETLLKNGLSGRKVLVMTECDVLTESVVKRIQEWQKKGGKIIADEFLCPALTADITLASYKREKKAAEDKAKLLNLASTLGPQVTSLGHVPKVTADSPEVILHTRKFGDALYIFAVNDRREAGTYVGEHNLVMENGLPTRTTLSLRQDNASIYELTTGSLIIPQRNAEGLLTWKLDLGPCDGRIFMVLPKPLLQLQAEVPATAKAGAKAEVKVTLTTTQDAPLKAVVPVQIEIRDANGKRAEGSGYYAAENGIITLPLDIATNDDPGTWEIRVQELASRMQTVKWMAVGR